MLHPGLLFPDITPRLAKKMGLDQHNKPVENWTDKHHEKRQQIKTILSKKHMVNPDYTNTKDTRYTFGNMINNLELHKQELIKQFKTAKKEVETYKSHKKMFEHLRLVSADKNLFLSFKTQYNQTILQRDSAKNELIDIQAQLNSLWEKMRHLAQRPAK